MHFRIENVTKSTTKIHTTMKRLLNYQGIILLLLISAMSFCACNDDDDDKNVALESYIIGSWHSFKGVVHYNGEAETINISKTGEYSAAYFEFDFKNDGTAIFRGWTQDEHGLSHWGQDNCTYVIRGDEVQIKDSTGEIISMFFSSKDKTLYIRSFSNDNGSQITTYIYFKK